MESDAQEVQEPFWTHAFDLAYRKLGETDFKDDQKFGIESFKDPNTGDGICISQVGSFGVGPGYGGIVRALPKSKDGKNYCRSRPRLSPSRPRRCSTRTRKFMRWKSFRIKTPTIFSTSPPTANWPLPRARGARWAARKTRHGRTPLIWGFAQGRCCRLERRTQIRHRSLCRQQHRQPDLRQ